MRPDTAEAHSHWSTTTWTAILTGLTALSVLTQGFHPLAEDGGLYVAGVKWLLNPQLFPHDAAFVRAHLSYSVFAPCVAASVRWLHVPLLWSLLAIYIASFALMLSAGRALLRRCGFDDIAQLAGVCLLAAWAAVPVAGTSLLLLDPYVTARSFSTPLCVWALAFSLDDWRTRHTSAWLCVLTLTAAAAFHPLMAVYGAALVLAARCLRSQRGRMLWLLVCVISVLVAAALQAHAAPDAPAEIAAVHSRYYWFLAQWQWFELLGLAGPLGVLFALRFWPHSRTHRLLADATIAAACLAVTVALLFAHESFRAHPVARLQPLRVFLGVYAVMLLLLGAALAQALLRRGLGWLIAVFLVASFAGGFAIARSTYPQSAQVEWPWAAPRNPWAQAFVWAREHTPPGALFALDARYVNEDGEDAQVFRAVAERSMLPDFSKDGGEAAITPSLAEAWQRGAEAQRGLSNLDDATRDRTLTALGVSWMVLHATAARGQPCPYQNPVVKVCDLTQIKEPGK